ncbi:aminotransferase class I/II-fold pyridoxal phosphate-dependent enzyme [Kocuria sp. CPCC 204721]|uniref:aminotransferase class I/II-fold pyridoxal phosphate-dependent enzyme n=1 Tax=Kocuria sp. CPCC 204721 TaxID=3073548 RepID=UPI0034D39CC9
MAVFAGAQAEVVHVAIDHEGLTPDELEETIEELESQDRRIKFLYTIPSFQNAGGTMMPQQRRDRICEVSAAHHVLIAEDNPYRLLGFEGQTARARRADDENVVYLGSASKMFTPGLRVGWTVAPDSLATILGLQSEAPVLNPSDFAQEVVAGCLEKYDWSSVLDEYRMLYGKWSQALMDAFYTDCRGEYEVRMSFCHPTDGEIRKGVEILATTLKKAMNA